IFSSHSQKVGVAQRPPTKSTRPHTTNTIHELGEVPAWTDLNQSHFSERCRSGVFVFQEFGVVKKTLYRQQGSFQEMDAAVASTFQQQQQLSGFRERLDQQQTGVQELAKQHQLQQQQLEELALQRARDQRYLEELCDSLQQHVDEKVSKCQAAADSLSTCSTRISLEQMDTSLALRRSLDHLSQEHRQLKSQLQGADQVKVTRGEDGWEIARSAGLD
ncbi:unnamed protein product, partial [Effrenium voratum]